MSFRYVKIDGVFGDDAACGVESGDRLLLDTARAPRQGDLALVKRGNLPTVCRWSNGSKDELVGVVIALKRRL